MLHKVIQHMSTARIFELLHMDLMGPMQTESLRGKSYGFVYVDVFSRYSWIHFLKEKSSTFDAYEALLLKPMLKANPHHKKVV